MDEFIDDLQSKKQQKFLNAIQNGDERKVVKYLSDNKGFVSIPVYATKADVNGLTPFLLAAKFQQPAILKILYKYLKKNYSKSYQKHLKAVDSEGNTAFHLLVLNKEKNLKDEKQQACLSFLKKIIHDPDNGFINQKNNHQKTISDLVPGILSKIPETIRENQKLSSSSDKQNEKKKFSLKRSLTISPEKKKKASSSDNHQSKHSSSGSLSPRQQKTKQEKEKNLVASSPFNEKNADNLKQNIGSIIHPYDDSIPRIPQEDIDLNNRHLLGTGGFGSVFTTQWQSCFTVAVKELIFSSTQLDSNSLEAQKKSLENEVKLMLKCHHPSIVKTYGIVEASTIASSSFYFVMEWVDGGSLNDHIKKGQKLEWPHRINLMYSVSLGLKYLHTNGIRHCDIKSHNIFLYRNDKSQWVGKLGDFGISYEKQNNTLSQSYVNLTQIVEKYNFMYVADFEGQENEALSEIYATARKEKSPKLPVIIYQHEGHWKAYGTDLKDIRCGIFPLDDKLFENAVSNQDINNKIQEALFKEIVIQKISATTWAGSLRWMSPELIKRQTAPSRSSDIYSFGILLWEMTSYQTPFYQYKDSTDPQLRQDIISGKRPIFLTEYKTPQDYQAIVVECWADDVKERMDANKVANSLGSCLKNIGFFRASSASPVSTSSSSPKEDNNHQPLSNNNSSSIGGM